MNKRYTNDDGKTKTRRRRILIALLLIVFAAAAFLALRSFGYIDLPEEPQATAVYLEDDGGSLEGEAERKEREDIMDELEKQQLIVTDTLSSNISFPSGEVGAVGEWVVENGVENTVIQQAEVYLDDVLIAQSTPIYPNQHITGVELLAEVAPGEYDVIAYLNYYDIETKAFLSKAGYNIHLTVK